MLLRLKTFAKDDAGAVTVDWVVITAGVVGLCIAAVFLMEDATLGLSDATGDAIVTSTTY